MMVNFIVITFLSIVCAYCLALLIWVLKMRAAAPSYKNRFAHFLEQHDKLFQLFDIRFPQEQQNDNFRKKYEEFIKASAQYVNGDSSVRPNYKDVMPGFMTMEEIAKMVDKMEDERENDGYSL